MDFEFIREQTPLYVEAAKLTLSFSMQKGEVVIVGPSGCGKSTFLRCINRLEETDSGVLKLDGVSYEKEKKNISKVREKIGMVFQSYDLFPNMTILNNLLLAPLKVQKRNKEEVKKEAESCHYTCHADASGNYAFG